MCNITTIVTTGAQPAAATKTSPPPTTTASTTTTTTTTTTAKAALNEKQQQAPGLGRLAFCSLGICVCFLYYGMLQEWLFSDDDDHENTHSKQDRLGPTFALVTACITNVIVAKVWQVLQEQIMTNTIQPSSSSSSNAKQSSSASSSSCLNHKLLFVTAGCYCLAMGCSNEAIHYVSYPVMVLMKSCKLIPLMIVGQGVQVYNSMMIVTKKKDDNNNNNNQSSSLSSAYHPLEWMAASLISFGIVLFQYAHMQQYEQVHHDDQDHEKDHTNLYGMILLTVSLLFDGILSSCQTLLKQKSVSPQQSQQSQPYRPPTAVETMFYINLYAICYFLPWSIYKGQCQAGLELLFSNNNNSNNNNDDSDLFNIHPLVWTMICLNVAVAIGQIFIFLTITWYSPIVTTTITTTRKFMTILLSVWRFGHVFSTLEWTGVVFVFVGLYLAILAAQQNQTHKQQQQAAKSKQE